MKFPSLRALFGGMGHYKTPLPPADAAHALGALLVRAAKSDKTYLFEEIAQIDRIIARTQKMNAVAAAKMRAECEVLEREMPETEDIVALLRDAIDVTEREATLVALWEVVFADGINHLEEDDLLHQIEAYLGVSPERALELQATVATR